MLAVEICIFKWFIPDSKHMLETEMFQNSCFCEIWLVLLNLFLNIFKLCTPQHTHQPQKNCCSKPFLRKLKWQAQNNNAPHLITDSMVIKAHRATSSHSKTRKMYRKKADRVAESSWPPLMYNETQNLHERQTLELQVRTKTTEGKK